MSKYSKQIVDAVSSDLKNTNIKVVSSDVENLVIDYLLEKIKKTLNTKKSSLLGVYDKSVDTALRDNLALKINKVESQLAEVQEALEILINHVS